MSQQPLQNSENKQKSILEDSLKVIQDRAKKQDISAEKQQENDFQQVADKNIDSKNQIQLGNNTIQYENSDNQKQKLRVNAVHSVHQNTNQSTNLSSQKSQNLLQIEQGENKSKSLLDSQNEFKKQEQSSEGSQIKILPSPLSYQKRSESNRYIQESQLNSKGSKIISEKDKQFDFSMAKGNSSIQHENYIGVENLQNKDFKEKRIISHIVNDQEKSQNQYQMSNEYDIISNQNSNQYIVTDSQDNNLYNNVGSVKQSGTNFFTPVKTDQKKYKPQQKLSQKDDKIAYQNDLIRQNQSLGVIINQSSPKQEKNKQIYKSSSNDQHQHFRMDGNYYQSISPEDNNNSKYSKNQFVIGKQQSSKLSGQIHMKKRNGQDDIQNNKSSIDHSRNNQRSNSAKKQIFTKSYYDDESHKKFILQKMKERKELQKKREKQYLEQQEQLKKLQIEELEEQNKKKEQMILQRAIMVQERMKKSKQYRESQEANKSSSREYSPILQKPLYIELQEKFQQNQLKEIEERKKILETEKAKKQNYKLEDIIKHQKELSQIISERQNSQQKKSQQQEWHYERPKYQSKLLQICEQEKNEKYKQQQEKLIMRKLKEERRHQFGQQVRVDSQNKNNAKYRNQTINNDSQNGNMENDTIEAHFLSESKYEQENSSKKMGREESLIEIKDDKLNKREQKNRRQPYYQYQNSDQKSINSLNQNSVNNINDFNQELTDNQVLNKISNSQHNLYHLSNRFRGSKYIQRQYTADQLLQSYDEKQIFQNNYQNQSKKNQKINPIQNYNYPKERSFERNNLMNEISIQNLPNVKNNSNNLNGEYTPARKQKNPPKKIYSAKDRLNSVLSSNQSFNNPRQYSQSKHEKTNDSKSTSEIYYDLIKLHDQNLSQKLNNKSKSVHERVQDVKVETQKMEEIANKQQKLLKVSSNEEIDRVFISDIYIKSIKAKLAVLDEIVPFYKNNSNHQRSQQEEEIQKQENSNQNINQKPQQSDKELASLQTQFSSNLNRKGSIKKLRFVEEPQIEEKKKNQ